MCYAFSMKRVDPKEFFSFLTERSAEIIGADSLRIKIQTPKKLRVKLGIDPTTPDLHLGHVVTLRILKMFQDAGHRAVLIIGDFTAQIGDPSGAAAARRQLTTSDVRRNERTYLSQASKVLDLRKTEVRHNSEWYGRMGVKAFLNLLARFSLKSAWQREDFQKRLAAGKEVHLHEAMYHVLQAYDSVAVRADVEIGALDQRLNIIAGRELQGKSGKTPQDIVLAPYLIGVDGKAKMSKSIGNTVNLLDSSTEMFGKVMSIPDHLIVNYSELAAWMSPAEVREIRRRLDNRHNPRDAKLDVAEAVTGLYHGSAAAQRARGLFLKLFSKKELTASVPALRLKHGLYKPINLLRIIKAASSQSEARRLIKGMALEVDGRAISDARNEVSIKSGSVIRSGKKKFFRVL